MYKIGVITHWGSLDNYGQTLQTYALQKKIAELGYEPFLIRYKEDGIKRPLWRKLLSASNPIYLKNALENKRLNRIDYNNNIIHKRDLRIFLDNTIEQAPLIYGRDDLLTEPPFADVYVTGSDQVWNKLDKSYFLDFIKDRKKIAYAASFGSAVYKGRELKEVGDMLKEFSHITVREKNGVNICKEAGIDDVMVVPDPTILIDAEHYRRISDDIPAGKPYMLIYMLGNKTDFDLQRCYEFAAENNLEVKYIAGQRQKDDYPKVYPSMQQWLGLIDNAACVVTNSFHGSVMSLILNTPFITVPLSGKNSKMNSRIETLLDNFDLNSRMTADLSVIRESIDFRKVNDRIVFLREFGTQKLLDMIER